MVVRRRVGQVCEFRSKSTTDSGMKSTTDSDWHSDLKSAIREAASSLDHWLGSGFLLVVGLMMCTSIEMWRVRAVLAPVYDRFTEGFSALSVKRGKALLDQLT